MKKRLFLLSLSALLVGCAETSDSQEPSKQEEFELASTIKDYTNENHNLIIQDDVIIFPEPDSLAQVQINTLGEELPETKDEGYLPVILTFSAGGATLDTYGEIKVQGSSTAKWPKKNWRLRFYADEDRKEELKIQIGDSVPSNKWIAKADWIDPTLLRNGVSFRLWESMVKSRNDFPQYEVDNEWIGNNNMDAGTQTGAQGFPKTHPIHVEVNDEHYGLSLLLLGHEPRNFNLDKENPKHVYMEFDARGGEDTTKTWEKFTADGVGQWIDSYHPKNEDFTDEQLEAVEALGQVINGSQENFEANFDKHFDKTNMIDMLLFLEAIYDWDAVAQDAEMVTYDLEKWYLLPWDKDTTFGLYWDESGLREDSATTLVFNYETEKVTQKPWFKTYKAFTPEVEARYAELRDEGIFSVNHLYTLAGDITKKIPNELWEAEKTRWEDDDRPSRDETSTAQLLSWFEERLNMLDEHFNYTSTKNK